MHEPIFPAYRINKAPDRLELTLALDETQLRNGLRRAGFLQKTRLTRAQGLPLCMEPVRLAL